MTHRLLPGAVVALLAVPALGQTPTPQSPVFGETVEVRVVNLEIVVTDRDGLSVTGLAPEDFRLLVDGAEVPIGYFTEVRGGDAVDTGAGQGDVASVPDLVPGTPVGTSYLLFIDDFFSIARDRDRVLRSVRDELGHLGPADRMAIVAFDGSRLTMLSTWTDSVSELERAIQKATSRPALGLQRLTEKRNLDADNRLRRSTGAGRGPLDNRLESFEIFYAERLEQQVGNIVSAVAAALRGFANPPGRKVLLMMSGGWPYDPADFAANEFGRPIVEPGIRRGEHLFAPLVDTANQLGYTIYSVDVPGLADDTLGGADQFELPELSDTARGFLRESNTQYSIQYAAQQTGGKALLNARRLAALRTAAADTRSYYWIGFVPNWQGNDSRHRAVVEVRRPGLRVRSRASFVDASRSTETSMAVESVLLFGGGPGVKPLPVRFGKPQRSSMNVMKVPVEIGIPLDGLTFVPTGDGFATEVELRIAALDDRGGRSDIPVVPVRLEFSERPAPGKLASYSTTLELRRVANHVVLAVYDPASGAIHSATADIRP